MSLNVFPETKSAAAHQVYLDCIAVWIGSCGGRSGGGAQKDLLAHTGPNAFTNCEQYIITPADLLFDDLL